MTRGRTFVLWLGVAAAPLAWFAQLAIGYESVEGGCAPGGGAGEVLGMGTDSAALVVTAIAALVAGIGVFAALVTWRVEEDPGYVRFLGFAGFVGGAVLLATILLAGIGILALSPCGQA